MPPVKDYFDPAKRQKLLKDAIRLAKGKGEFTFAFGICKSGSLLAIDAKDEHDPEKFLRQIKASEFKEKFIVGTASIKGQIIDMKSAHAKNVVKPKDVKNFLAPLKLTVCRAIIDGKGDEDEADGSSGTAADASGPPEDQGASREQTRVALDKALEEIDQLLEDL